MTPSITNNSAMATNRSCHINVLIPDLRMTQGTNESIPYPQQRNREQNRRSSRQLGLPIRFPTRRMTRTDRILEVLEEVRVGLH
jgi:hypothetical protein